MSTTANELVNPLLAKATRYGDQDRAQLSSYTGEPQAAKPRKRASAKTERLIAELGLRYRPSVQADLEEHAATLALLTTDVADIPPDLLEQAIRRHVMKSPYMPKASELIELARNLLNQKQQARSDMPLVDRWNARLAAEGRYDIRWIDDNGQMKLEQVSRA